MTTNFNFRKKDEHLITYRFDGYATQVDYVLVHRGDCAMYMDCKVVLGDCLLVMAIRMRKRVKRRRI